jgi:hypothetical protein
MSCECDPQWWIFFRHTAANRSQFEPIHLGHPDIRDNDIDTARKNNAQGLMTIPRCENFEALLNKSFFDQAEQRDLVIHKKNDRIFWHIAQRKYPSTRYILAEIAQPRDAGLDEENI